MTRRAPPLPSPVTREGTSITKAVYDHGHGHWMDMALTLARSMRGWVWPNPPVGCVIVRNGDIVGTGVTQIGGRPHAERVALDAAGDQARGADLYVTLEPCCHFGKTPPCADAIIAAGLTAVHAAIQDPDPRVDGGGFARLRASGVRVEVGLGATEARDIMAGFFHRIATGRPLLAIGHWPRHEIEIPDGFDGLLRCARRQIELVTRCPAETIHLDDLDLKVDPAGFLDALGRRGLTNLTVAANDPLAEWLAEFVRPTLG